MIADSVGTEESECHCDLCFANRHFIHALLIFYFDNEKMLGAAQPEDRATCKPGRSRG